MMNVIRNLKREREQAGQALVEYALILALLALAMAVALSATGPAIANVFRNVICNVAGQNPCGQQIASLSPLGNPSDNGFWGTVTWVAGNPLERTPFPTVPLIPPSAEPTSGAPPPILSPVPTDIPPPPPPLDPTDIPPDRAFSVVFQESGDPGTSTFWRLDNSVWLGGDDWLGRYYPSTNFSGSATIVRNRDIVGPLKAVALDFNYGTNAPLAAPWTLTDNFSVRWTRRVEATNPTAVTFRLIGDDQATLRICPTEQDAIDATGACTILLNNIGTAGASFDTTISGTQWLSVSYVETTGTANIRLDMTNQGIVNSADIVPSGGQCNWGRTTSNQDVNTLDWMWDENPTSDNWPANQRCVLELRGYVDLTGVTNPTLSFYDVWDLPAGTSASLQLGAYNADTSLISWQTVNLRTGAANFRNYQWTRNQVSLTSIPGLGNSVAVRFVLESGGTGGNPVRWYLDDIEVKPQPDRTFTVNSRYNMDSGTHRDFFFNSGRWNVSTSRVVSGSGWELSAAPNFSQSAAVSGGPRIHFIELAGNVDLRPAVAPATDDEGDTGTPVVSFYHAYQAVPGAMIQLQYTRDARDTTPDTWQTVPVGTAVPPQPGGMLVDNSTGTSSLSDLTMQRVEILLDQIPDWNVTPFRLRWALVVPQAGANNSQWWIDQISIERTGGDRFAAYPFQDSAESTSFTMDHWRATGRWGVQNGTGVGDVAGSSANFYADSPNTDFVANTATLMEMRRWIDLFYDTDVNRNNPGGIGEPTPSNPAYNQTARRAATAQPMLVFWLRRDVVNGVTLSVDLTTKALDDNNPASDAEWRQVWTYTAPAAAGATYDRWRQDSWERIEVDLRQALQVATTSNYAALLASASQIDDDIKIRFRLNTGASTANGVFVDGIQIIDLQRPVHRLWSGSPLAGSALAGQSVAGSGATYSDTIDGATPTTLLAAEQRWYLAGGTWRVANTGRAPSASATTNALDDSPGADYPSDSFIALEQQPVIDLRGITAAQVPNLVYYQRYEVVNPHSMRLQVSTANAGQTDQRLGLTAGWSAWTDLNSTSYYNEMSGNQQRVGWQRIQVNLTPYVGQQIRLRWVINAFDGSRADGWVIDDLSYFYNGSGAGTTTAIPLPFTALQSTSASRWIMDGTWGTTYDWFNPATESSVFGAQALGSSSWRAYWANCSIISATGQGCSASGSRNALEQYWPMPAPGATTLSALSTTAGTATSRAQFAANAQPVSDVQMNNAIRIIVSNLGTSQGPLGIMEGAYVADASYLTNVGGRFMRNVQLTPGTYVFQISHNDNTRLRINNGTGTNFAGSPATIYLDGCGGAVSRSTICSVYMTVTAVIDRVLVLDYWGASGGNHLFLNVARLGSSFSDSPNWNGVDASINSVDSLQPSKTSMMLNGYFNTSGVANPTLRFTWIARQDTGTRLFVDVSTDGGFTWTVAPASWNTGDTRFPADFAWQSAAVSLPQAASVMIRFRYNTDADTSDGVYISDIDVRSG